MTRPASGEPSTRPSVRSSADRTAGAGASVQQVSADTKAWYEAQLALAEGQPERAIALLQPIVEWQQQPFVNWCNDLADAWLATGHAEQAIRVLERVPPRRYGPLTPPHHWLAQQDRLGRLYRQVGRTADADRVDDRLRVLLTFADNDHPIKRRLESLGGGR